MDTQITVLFLETVPVPAVERRDAGCRTCRIRGATPPKSQAEADARLVLVDRYTSGLYNLCTWLAYMNWSVPTRIGDSMQGVADVSQQPPSAVPQESRPPACTPAKPRRMKRHDTVSCTLTATSPVLSSCTTSSIIVLPPPRSYSTPIIIVSLSPRQPPCITLRHLCCRRLVLIFFLLCSFDPVPITMPSTRRRMRATYESGTIARASCCLAVIFLLARFGVAVTTSCRASPIACVSFG